MMGMRPDYGPTDLIPRPGSVCCEQCESPLSVMHHEGKHLVAVCKGCTREPPTEQHAFPHLSHGATGMTLRDWFAGKVLTSAFVEVMIAESDSTPEVAEVCYKIADAMLKERE